MGHHVFFIGGGNMASAIIAGLDKSWTVSVSDPNHGARENLTKKYGVNAMEKPTKGAFDTVDVVVFAVKPQYLSPVLESLRPFDFSGKVIVSIMAGVLLKKISSGLNGKDMKM